MISERYSLKIAESRESRTIHRKHAAAEGFFELDFTEIS